MDHVEIGLTPAGNETSINLTHSFGRLRQELRHEAYDFFADGWSDSLEHLYQLGKDGPGAAMLAEAAFWRPSEPRESVDEVLRRPELAHYVTGWPRPGDRGLVAEYETDVPVGAAWLRFFSEADPGYGFVDAAVPELSMGVVPSARGQGVGRRLLKGLIDASRSAGLPGISLSVESDNYARRLYEQSGFRPVGPEDGGAVTMQLSF